jgi:acyl-coenzyme A synthetase/AMP-(fatty) acid ligase
LCALDASSADLHGRSVLIRTAEQLPTVLAALALDGLAGRILLCPPDLPDAHLAAIAAEGAVDLVVTDGVLPVPPGIPVIACRSALDRPAPAAPAPAVDTEWVLFTSGTTGRPKLVRHSLAALTGHLVDGVAPDRAIWGTFYDVRRYGGLSIVFRALLGGASMVLSTPSQPLADFLRRAGAEGVTHMTGTPSHWRQALMSPAITALAPAYVRLSGEIADQAILDRLRIAFPAASIAHAFASTEAGLAFDVRDGLAGFPVALLERPGGAEIRIVEGTLRIRSARTASGYLGTGAFRDDAGFIDTGDMVERRGDRFFFIGRREGVINVGGLKVFPEEVEAVLNAHPAIRAARVWGRSSPLVGAVVAADIVLEPGHGLDAVRDSVLDACRAALPPHKVPVSLRAVAGLPVAESGKLVRTGA